MTSLDNQILHFSEQINRYGYAVTISAVKNGINTSIQQAFIPIEELTDGGSLFVFFKELIANLHPNELTVVAKLRNGASAYKNPKTFILDIPTSLHQNPNSISDAGLFGLPPNLGNSKPTNNSALVEILQFKLSQLQQDLQEAKPFKNRYEDEREKRFDLERELKLKDEKHELQKTRDELNSKNSLAGVLTEFKEPITEALAGFASAKLQGQSNDEMIGLGATSNPKISFLASLFGEMDENVLESLFEINARMIFAPKIVAPILKTLQDKTHPLDEKIEELLNDY